MDFKRYGGDVELLNGVVATHARSIFVGWVKQKRGWRIDQVKNRSQIDGKTLLSLANKHLALVFACWTAGNGHGVNVLPCVGGVIGDGLGSDVVHRLFKSAAAGGFYHRAARTFAPLAAHYVDAVGFVDIQVGVVEGADGSGLHQRNRHTGCADLKRNRLQVVLKAKLKSNVFLGVTIVVDVNFVQRIGVHLEIVGATVRGLQRLVICQQSHVIRAAARPVGGNSFIASEHVKVSTVYLGAGGDEGCLAVAGCNGTACGSHQKTGLCKAGKFQFHRYAPGWLT